MSSAQVLAVLVISKFGLLLFSRVFAQLPNSDSDTLLRFASSFHTIHSIAAKSVEFGTAQEQKDSVVPASSGIINLEYSNFKVHCLSTLTGMKFLLLSNPSVPSATVSQDHDVVYGSADRFLQQLYSLYSEYGS